jgi:hypothetical protein
MAVRLRVSSTALQQCVRKGPTHHNSLRSTGLSLLGLDEMMARHIPVSYATPTVPDQWDRVGNMRCISFRYNIDF